MRAIVFSHCTACPSQLGDRLREYCPQIELVGAAMDVREANSLCQDRHPDLLFFDAGGITRSEMGWLKGDWMPDCEVIVLSETLKEVLGMLDYGVTGFLRKPVSGEELLIAVHNARAKIALKRQAARGPAPLRRDDDLIGVPTLDGFDFIAIKNIIRCEGLQKCTRVVTTSRTNIISSYNIGAFRQLLEPYHFFSSHKSHLISLRYVRKYKREGMILMADDTWTPISRRKKKAFLDSILHV